MIMTYHDRAALLQGVILKLAFISEGGVSTSVHLRFFFAEISVFPGSVATESDSKNARL